MRKQNRTASLGLVLHARIKVLFYQVGLEEKEMLHVLQQKGFNIQALIWLTRFVLYGS
jgi:phage gp16-like protein